MVTHSKEGGGQQREAEAELRDGGAKYGRPLTAQSLDDVLVGDCDTALSARRWGGCRLLLDRFTPAG